MITLTVAQIVELVEFAGLTLHPAHMPDDDDLETEFTIQDCPKGGVLDDEGVARHYGLVAYCTDYPEEGCMPLGPEIERTAAADQQQAIDIPASLKADGSYC